MGEANSQSTHPLTEAFPLIWTGDVAALADWTVQTLGLVESWRAPGETGVIEHAEVHWFSCRVSINIRKSPDTPTGTAGISLRVDDRAEVDRVYAQAKAANARLSGPPEESPVAYSFTAYDADGNQWWVNAETGFLDTLRDSA